MARRGWDSLSEGYRRRLERGGITRAGYESGAGLQKARGHKSAAHERVQSRSYRNLDRWVERFSETYGRDPDDVRAEITQHGLKDAEKAMQRQQELERLYNEGNTEQATSRWKMGPHKPYPDWLFYYHGAFS